MYENIDFRTNLCDIYPYEELVMDGKEFKKRVKKLARSNGVSYREENRGKGSHERVYYGANFTTVKHSEIGPGLLHEMCKQLGINKQDL